MKCCMESNISHCFADLFTSRPRAYSERGLRQLLKLRLLKVNNQDIQKIYFGVLNHEYDNNLLYNSETIKLFSNKTVDAYQIPYWLKVIVNSYSLF